MVGLPHVPVQAELQSETAHAARRSSAFTPQPPERPLAVDRTDPGVCGEYAPAGVRGFNPLSLYDQVLDPRAELELHAQSLRLLV